MDTTKAGNLLYEFYQSGSIFWQKLIGDIRTDGFLDKLHDALTEGMPTAWYLQEPELIAAQIPEIQMKGPREFLLPLDVLPLGTWQHVYQDWEISDLCKLVSLFGAFSSVIQYVSLGSRERGRADEAASERYRDLSGWALPMHPAAEPEGVIYLRSEDTDAFKDMGRTLTEVGMTLYGPDPSHEGLDDANKIASVLVHTEPYSVPDPGVEGVPAFRHVHAHAETRPESLVQQLVVHFVYGETTLDVNSGHLHAALTSTLATNRSFCGPIVMLSACHAMGGADAFLTSSSFDLTEGGCRAVIGPREAVPELFAYAMARGLYRAVIGKFAIGRALMVPRWALLQKRSNPLGILYAVFGDPITPI